MLKQLLHCLLFELSLLLIIWAISSEPLSTAEVFLIVFVGGLIYDKFK